jgi:hypothetical protein
MTERHTTFEKLRRHAAASRGCSGVRRFRSLLLNDEAPRSKSELEAAAVALLRRYGFDPQQNVEIDGEEADIVAGGVIIELDSEEFHDNPIQAAEDARRHDHWVSNARPVERLTWDDVHVTPVRSIRRLARVRTGDA